MLGFQFEPTKVLELDSSLDEIWETIHQQSEPSITRQSEALIDTCYMCFDCSQMSAMKDCSCCHELNRCEYFKVNGFYIYLLTILQIFFIKLIHEHAVLKTIILRKCTLFYKKIIYKKLGLGG